MKMPTSLPALPEQTPRWKHHLADRHRIQPQGPHGMAEERIIHMKITPQVDQKMGATVTEFDVAAGKTTTLDLASGR